MLADLGQGLVKIRFLFVKGVEHNHFGDAVLRGKSPDGVGAHAHAVVGMDHHHGKITDPQSPQSFTDEIRVTRAIQDVKFLSQPIQRASACVETEIWRCCSLSW